MNTVLIVEDEPHSRRFVRLALEGEGCRVLEADRLNGGLEQAAAEKPDLVVLDLGLPDGDGLEFIRAYRAWSERPLVVLSARSLEADKVAALDAGADDYIAKPFGVAELLARVRALFRRVDALGRTARQEAGRLEAGALSIDPVSRQVRCKGEAVELTAREFDLLFFFARHPGQVFSRMDLLAQVWGYSHEGYEHTVNTHINRLRGKIEMDPARPDMIRTVWGVGYKFTPETDEGGTP